jgi:hypothetical protein
MAVIVNVSIANGVSAALKYLRSALREPLLAAVGHVSELAVIL